jgi:hypothetical protein
MICRTVYNAEWGVPIALDGWVDGWMNVTKSIATVDTNVVSTTIPGCK